MSEAKKIRNKWLTIRMTEAEYEELIRLSKKTTCRQLSQYGRNVLLNKPVYVKYRSESLDAFLNATVDIRREFKAVGFNFNQVVHRLHTLQEIPEFRAWVLVNEKHKELLFSKIKAIQDRMNEAYDLWQKCPPSQEPNSEG
jgi:MobC-like protein